MHYNININTIEQETIYNIRGSQFLAYKPRFEEALAAPSVSEYFFFDKSNTKLNFWEPLAAHHSLTKSITKHNFSIPW